MTDDLSQDFERNPDDGSITVILKRPVEGNGKTYREIRLRGEATVADLEAMDKAKGDVGRSVYLIAELGGLPLSAVRGLSPADWARVQSAVTEILGK